MAKKRHHYVPIFYLKGFTCTHEPERIWVYPTDGSSPFMVNVTRTAVEKYFYAARDEDGNFDPDTVEDFLDKKVEAPANPIIKKLRNRKRISQSEKKKLARYLAYMLTRVPANRERVRQEIPRLVSDTRRITQEVFRESDEPQPSLLRDALKALERVESGLIQELSLPYLNEHIYHILRMMNWATFVAYPGSAIVTSDNPFCYSEHVGLVNEESRFIFPLTSKAVMIGSWAPFPAHDFAIWYVPLSSREDNDAINRIVIASATKYVFHNENCEWVRDLIAYVDENRNR